MPDYRCFHPPCEEQPAWIYLSREESHHLLRVNRARKGDPVIVFNGTGTEWICRLDGEEKGSARLSVQSQRKATSPPFSMALAQSLPKGKTMDAIVRKSTEIGARTIIPLVSKHTEVKVRALSGRGASKEEKWTTAALEAAKQSGNSYLPSIEPVQSLASFLDLADRFELRLIASLQPETVSLRNILQANFNQATPPGTAVCLIGPEGDFTQEEVEAAKDRGFFPISLGPYVLRCETAATVALAIATYELSNLWDST